MGPLMTDKAACQYRQSKQSEGVKGVKGVKGGIYSRGFQGATETSRESHGISEKVGWVL